MSPAAGKSDGDKNFTFGAKELDHERMLCVPKELKPHKSLKAS